MLAPPFQLIRHFDFFGTLNLLYVLHLDTWQIRCTKNSKRLIIWKQSEYFTYIIIYKKVNKLAFQKAGNEKEAIKNKFVEVRWEQPALFLQCQVRKLASLFQLLTVHSAMWMPKIQCLLFWLSKYPSYITSLQQQIFSFLFCCKLLPQKIIFYTNHFRINYHIS